MKKIITLSTLVFASVILAGCTLFDTPEKTVEVVNLNTGSVEDARTQCLNLPNHQWNDASQECEKPTDKALCLQGENQWNEKINVCEFSKSTCLAEGFQWNEKFATCEFTKEQCLEMQAQRDEQDAKCERVPQTTEQQKTDCLNEGGQWDYSGNVCQQKTMEISVEQMESYSLADVEMHATQDSCRAAIDGKVYDLTNWVNKHPGGADKIVAICGTDATEAFANQHDAQEKPENQLMQFAIGVLAQ